MLWIAIFAIVFIAVLLLNERMAIDVWYNPRMGVKLAFTLMHITVNYDNNKQKKKKKRGYSSTVAIIKRLIDVLGVSTLLIRRLAISVTTDRTEEHERYLKEYRYHAVISAIVAYFKERSKSLVIYDNAIILIPDGDVKFDINVTLSLKLFHVMRACIDLLIIDHKEKIRRRRSNVGN